MNDGYSIESTATDCDNNLQNLRDNIYKFTVEAIKHVTKCKKLVIEFFRESLAFIPQTTNEVSSWG